MVMSCVYIRQRCVTVLILTISRTAAARRTVLRYCTSLKSTVLVNIIPSNIYHHKYIHPPSTYTMFMYSDQQSALLHLSTIYILLNS